MRLIPFVLAVFATLGASATLAGCAGEPTSTAEAAVEGPAIVTAGVQAASWRPTVEITGSLEPVASVQVGFDVPGRIDRILAARGATVAAGDPLGSLDHAIASAQVAQAEAGVAAAAAGAEAAEKAWTRIEAVGDAVSDQQRTEVSAALAGARAQLDQARAAHRMARTQLAYHTLKAPIAGLVTSAPDNAGALVGAGTPLFVVEDLSSLRLKGTAPETEAWLAAGLEATVYPGTPGATEGFPARVDLVIPSLDPATRRVPVEIRVDQPPPALKAHGFGRAVITAASEEAVWSVPRGALVARPDFSVLVLPEGTDEPRRVPVTVLREGDQILVRGELTAADRVVVNPPHGYGG